MTEDCDNKQPGYLRLVMVLATIVLMVGFLEMLLKSGFFKLFDFAFWDWRFSSAKCRHWI